MKPKSKEVNLERLENCTQVINDLTSGLSEEDCNFKPFGKAWSVLEVIEHMSLLGNLVMDRMEPTIRKHKGNAEKPEKLNFFERWFLGYLNPKSKLKLKAPKMYKPASSDLEKTEVLERFEKMQNRMAQNIRQAEESDQRKKFRSPFTTFMRLTVAGWIEAGITHEERHIEQIKKVLKQLEKQKSN